MPLQPTDINKYQDCGKKKKKKKSNTLILQVKLNGTKTVKQLREERKISQ